MAFIPLGTFAGLLRQSSSVSFNNIRGGVITAQELIMAGGTDGVMRSQNFNDTDAGWAIFGDGSAKFFGGLTIGVSAVMLGDIRANTWDGTVPANLSSVDAGATAGYYLDTSTGAGQFQKLFVGAVSGHVELHGGGFAGIKFHAEDLTTNGFIINGVTNIGGGDIGTIIMAPGFDTGSSGPQFIMFAAHADDGGDRVAFEDVDHLDVTDGVIFTAAGTVALPAYSFDADQNTGMWNDGSDRLGFTFGGALPMIITSRLGVRWSFQNPTGSAHNGIAFEIKFSGTNAQQAIYVPDGTVGAPGIGFLNDNDVGIWRQANDILSFSTGGTKRGAFRSYGFESTNKVIVRGSVLAHDPDTTGTAATAYYASTSIGEGIGRRLVRSTSARKYKSRITYNVDYLADIELKPAKFYRKDDHRWFIGFIADDLAEENRLLGDFDPDGEIENYDPRAVLAVLAAKVSRLEAELSALRKSGKLGA